MNMIKKIFGKAKSSMVALSISEYFLLMYWDMFYIHNLEEKR